MHLVLVSSLIPVENPSSGFDIANRAILDGLVTLGHRVSVIGFLQPGQTPAKGGEMHVLGELEVTNARVGARTKLKWLTTALVNRTTLSSAKMLQVSTRRIETLLASLQPFDGLLLNSIQLAAAFAPVFQRHPSIYIAHNAEAVSALENARCALPRSIEKYLFLREAAYLKTFERRMTANASRIWTLSEEDRFAFGPAVAGRATFLPLVTQWDPPLAPAGDTPQYDLGLIGSWSWRANRVGLDWFLEAVVPLLPRDMSIAVAGQLSEKPAVAHPGLTFLGRVPCARAFVGNSAVVPLISRGGTGVQLKTIETFEMGMPSVATSASLRGIRTIPRNCFVADDPAAFASALIARVAAVREGKEERVSGALFHETQKSALAAALEQGVSVFGGSALAPCRQPSRSTKRIFAAPMIAVEKGGKTR